MSDQNRHLAIIPARSGSKGLPGKNIRQLGGLPLMAWTIKTAVASGLFDTIILSTDSAEYARIGRKFGASVPWLRHPELATDESLVAETILETIDRFRDQGNLFTHFTLLQPTSPLRSTTDLEKAWDLFNEKQAGAVVSVSPCDHPPQWCNTLPANGELESFIPEKYRAPRQLLEPMYRVNGAIYISDVEWFRQHRGFLSAGSFAYVMPAERSVDIDTETDFMLAEAIIQSNAYSKPWSK